MSIVTNLLIKGTVILAAAYGLSFVLRRASAATRHMIWTLAALSLLLLPALSLLTPVWEVPVAIPTGVVLSFDATDSAAAAVAPTAPVKTVPPRPQRAAWLPHLAWSTWILIAWLAGVAAALLRFLLGAATAAWMAHRARALPIDCLEELKLQLGIRARVRVLESERAAMPMTFGMLRPTILLPKDAETWSAERRHVVLAHELAHVKRWDVFTQALARMAFSLYWFHPLAWLASRQFIKEREHASDDLVLSTGTRASDYAAHLLDVARSFAPRANTAWAAVAMARRSQLEGRLLAILDSHARRGILSRAGVAAMTALALCLVLPLAAMRPPQAAAPQLPDNQQLEQQVQQSGDYAVLERLADQYEQQHKYAQAEVALRRAVDLLSLKFGVNSPEFAAGLLKLARAAQHGRPLFQAVPLYRQALEILDKTAGESPAMVEALEYLGVTAIRENPQQSQQYLERALAIRSKSGGPDRPTAATLLMDLGLLQELQDKLPEAEQYYQRAMAAQPEQEGSEMATTLELYARVLDKMQRAAEAANMRIRAKDMRVRVFEDAASPDKVVQVVPRNWSGNRLAAPTSKYRVGAGVSAPTLKSKIEPEYTEVARILKYQATSVLSIEVGPDGMAHNIQVVRPAGYGLDEKAAEALSQWHFTPGMKEGQPVTVQATVEVNFRLL